MELTKELIKAHCEALKKAIEGTITLPASKGGKARTVKGHVICDVYSIPEHKKMGLEVAATLIAEEKVVEAKFALAQNEQYATSHKVYLIHGLEVKAEEPAK